MKTRITAIVALVFCAFALGLAPASRAAEEFKGNWTIMTSKEPGQVRFGLIHHLDGHNSQSESDWPMGEFLGVDLSSASRRDVAFSITRDAGRFDCKGYLEDGEGAGIFRFAADAQYRKDMSTLGFEGIDEEMQFAMAVHDVSLEFARTMKAEKLSGLTTGMLMAFRIHGVTLQFIREIRAAGLTADDSDKLVAFRIHGVTPAFVAKVETLGYRNLEPDQLVAMRIHGVTPEYITDMKARGLKNLTIDQLVNLRIHGID
jgi:hypothetical protein